MTFKEALEKFKKVLPKEALDLLLDFNIQKEEDFKEIKNPYLHKSSTKHPRVQMTWKIRAQRDSEWMKQVYKLVSENDYYWFGLYYDDNNEYAYYFTEDTMIMNNEVDYRISKHKNI